MGTPYRQVERVERAVIVPPFVAAVGPAAALDENGLPRSREAHGPESRGASPGVDDLQPCRLVTDAGDLGDESGDAGVAPRVNGESHGAAGEVPDQPELVGLGAETLPTDDDGAAGGDPRQRKQGRDLGQRGETCLDGERPAPGDAGEARLLDGERLGDLAEAPAAWRPGLDGVRLGLRVDVRRAVERQPA